jgi:hypothetical protein
LTPASRSARRRFGRDRAGVHLKRHLGVRVNVELTSQRFEHARDLRGREQRRRAAAEVDGVDFGGRASEFEGLYLARECADVRFGERRLEGPRGEVAVRAARAAEGDVDVYSGAIHL